MPRLCRLPAFPLERLPSLPPHLRFETRLETDMADIFFLALGTGAFALFGLYAALLRKV